MHEVSEKANMPTFGMSDTYLGHGIVGGKLLSPAYQGRRLIRTALKILNDEPIKNTGSLKGDNQVMFDWRQLKRWSINEKDLPPNSVVKYKEHSIWDAHKGKIIGAISIILSQGLAVIFLLIQRKRRSHAESESRSLRDDLAHISRVMSMGEMATSLAHEVNQPLTAIQSYAQAAQRFLQRQPPEYKEVSNSLEGVVEGSRRAKQVIQRIRMTLDKEPSERSTNKVRDLINGVLLLVQGKINEKKIHLKLDIENGLPKVICDQVQLQQVLLNLIINGIDAICEKSVEVRELTVLAYQEQDENVVISVKDSGVGIDENILKQPFDAFYTTKKEGLGMGLSISKSIIEDHGGRLWITKNQDRGVTVSFTVPVSKENLR
jgi:signal transduction histidine kinase